MAKRPPARLRVVHYGLGPIGCRIAQYLHERGAVDLVGGIDTDPAKAGADLGVVAGLPTPLGVAVGSDAAAVLSQTRPDVAVLATTSSLRQIEAQVMGVLQAGVHVLSTCEELVYPWRTAPDLARRLDHAARAAKVAVLSTGVNPGFLMDLLPAVLTGVCRSVEQITVERFQDARFRRLPFQRKIGAGLTVEEFAARVRAGSLRHVGLTESVHLIAQAAGLDVEQVRETIEPVVATQPVETPEMTVPTGRCLGVYQTGIGLSAAGGERIRLLFRATIGEASPRDRVVIAGTPSFEAVIPGGVNGDVATAAIVANAAAAMPGLRPGLRTMLDVPPVTCRR